MEGWSRKFRSCVHNFAESKLVFKKAGHRLGFQDWLLPRIGRLAWNMHYQLWTTKGEHIFLEQNRAEALFNDRFA